MIDRTHGLSVTKQAEALGISRGAVYYEPRARSAFDLALMRRIDAVPLEMPWFGARGLKRVLKTEFPGVGRRRITTLMQTMGIAAVCPQPGSSKRHRALPVYPYLLRHRTITRPNEASYDATYWSRAAASQHGDSAHFVSFVAIVPPMHRWSQSVATEGREVRARFACAKG